MEQKQLNLLGLAQRARQVISGDELLTQAVKAGKVRLILVARDVSEKTMERYTKLADRHQIPLNKQFTMAELSQAIGKKRALLGLTDQGFAKKFKSYETGASKYE